MSGSGLGTAAKTVGGHLHDDQIIIETLMSCGTGLSPDFAGLLTTAIGERVPSTDRPPWFPG